MALDFPAAPIVGELYPNPEQSGIPQYIWDGSAWQSAPGSGQSTFVERAGDTMLGHLALVENPSDPDAVRKDYVDNAIATNVPPPPDLSGYVAKAGDVMTGALTTPNLKMGSTSLTESFNEWGSMTVAGAVYFDFHSSGTVPGYGVRSRAIVEQCGTGQGALTMEAAGGFNVTGPVTTPGLTVNGVANIYGNITAHGSQVYASSLRADGAITGGDITATGNFWTGATYYFRGNGGIYLTHDGSNFVFGGANVYTGNGFYGAYISSSGDIYAGNNITAIGAYYSTNGLNVTGASNGNPWIVGLLSGNPQWAAIYQQMLHYPGQWAGMNWDLTGNGTFSFRGGGLAYKSGGQIYWDGSSDARIKRVLGDYTQGLDAVCALNPVRYVYKGNETYIAPSHFSGTVGSWRLSEPWDYGGILRVTPCRNLRQLAESVLCSRPD